MTYLQWNLLISGISLAMWIGALVAHLLRKHLPEDTSFVLGAGGALTTLLAVACWGIFAGVHNEQTKDRNYCASLEARGHDSLFVEYNFFNRDCFVLVDDQWIRIEDSAFGRNA